MNGAPRFEQWASLVASLSAHRPDGSIDGPLDGTSVETGRSAGPDDGAVPVAIVCGFLGAGKSTLLAALLADPGPGRVVRAVVNDVGRLPFDPSLVAAADGGRVELTNGCGCCVAGAASEVGAALDRAAPGADLVVLEASGVADPAAVAQIVAARPGLRLDRTVAVADARSLGRLADDPAIGSTVRRQLATAGAVVVTHADALGPGELDAAVTLAATLAPGCPVVVSTMAQPAHRALTPALRIGAALPAGMNTGLTTGPFDPVVETLVPRRSLAAAELAAALAGRPAGVLRGKGRLLVDGRPMLVQFTPTVPRRPPSEGPVQAGDSTSIEPTEPGPTGLTVVAADERAMAVLAEAIEAVPVD